jgi:hypothetical protein
MFKKLIIVSHFFVTFSILSGELTFKSDSQYFVVAPSGLILREKPDTKSNKLGLIRYNSIVKVTRVTKYQEKISGLHNKWVQIQYNGKSGYIFSGFLSRYEGPPLDCRSIQKYLENVYGSLPEPQIISNNQSRESDGYQKEKRFKINNNITYVVIEYFESQTEKLIFKDLSFQEAYLILISIDNRYKNKKFRVKTNKDYPYGSIIDNVIPPDEDGGCIRGFFDFVTIFKEKNGNLVILTGVGC